MKYLFAVCAVALVGGGYVLCPHHLKAEAARALTPSAELVDDVRAGAEALSRHLSGGWDVYPSSPA